jgi:hypothetical protein
MQHYVLATVKDLQNELATIRAEFDERTTDSIDLDNYRRVRQYLLGCLVNFRAKHR